MVPISICLGPESSRSTELCPSTPWTQPSRSWRRSWRCKWTYASQIARVNSSPGFKSLERNMMGSSLTRPLILTPASLSEMPLRQSVCRRLRCICPTSISGKNFAIGHMLRESLSVKYPAWVQQVISSHSLGCTTISSLHDARRKRSHRRRRDGRQEERDNCRAG